MWLLKTASGLYLDDAGGWTRERAAGRVYHSQAGAQRMARAVLRRDGVALSVEPLHTEARTAHPKRDDDEVTPAQRRALELAAAHGGLRCAGEGWVPLGTKGPCIAPVTVSSLVRRGELAVTVEGPGRDGRRFGHRRYRRRWLEVRPRNGSAASSQQGVARGA